jgi:hypothetical protein
MNRSEQPPMNVQGTKGMFEIQKLLPQWQWSQVDMQVVACLLKAVLVIFILHVTHSGATRGFECGFCPFQYTRHNSLQGLPLLTRSFHSRLMVCRNRASLWGVTVLHSACRILYLLCTCGARTDSELQLQSYQMKCTQSTG